eukprot:Amastigsp_a516345_2.p2 type:complete len:109 gc:universal Amastigsp_a516345_2:1-327(+)
MGRQRGTGSAPLNNKHIRRGELHERNENHGHRPDRARPGRLFHRWLQFHQRHVQSQGRPARAGRQGKGNRQLPAVAEHRRCGAGRGCTGDGLTQVLSLPEPAGPARLP